MITKIDHIGIAVNSIDNMLKFYTETLGLQLKGVEAITGHNVKTAIFQIGESKIELLESTTPDGPIAKYIEKKGEGLHHLAFEVANVSQAIEEMKTKGIAMIDQKPRLGAENAMIAFMHPKESKVLMELVETEKK